MAPEPEPGLVLRRAGFTPAGFGIWHELTTGRRVLQDGERFQLTTARGRELGRAWDSGALAKLLDFWRDRR